jgi:hypothetical protein
MKNAPTIARKHATVAKSNSVTGWSNRSLSQRCDLSAMAIV